MTMTEQDARAALRVLASASGRDAEDLLRCSVTEVSVLIAAYRDAVSEKDRTDLDRVSEWLGIVAKVASPLGSIISAMSGGVGLISSM